MICSVDDSVNDCEESPITPHNKHMTPTCVIVSIDCHMLLIILRCTSHGILKIIKIIRNKYSYHMIAQI